MVLPLVAAGARMLLPIFASAAGGAAVKGIGRALGMGAASGVASTMAEGIGDTVQDAAIGGAVGALAAGAAQQFLGIKDQTTLDAIGGMAGAAATGNMLVGGGAGALGAHAMGDKAAGMFSHLQEGLGLSQPGSPTAQAQEPAALEGPSAPAPSHRSNLTAAMA